MSGATRRDRSSDRPQWRQFLFGALIALLTVAANTALAALGVYHAGEFSEFDRLMLTLGTPDSPSTDLTLVTIDNQDYRTLFGSTSPLDKDTVASIVNAITEFAPAVLGVDLVTADWQPPIPGIEPRKTRVVWAATRNAQGGLGLDWLATGSLDGHARCVAVPVFYPDGDGTIRKQVSSIEELGHIVPSFPAALRDSFDSFGSNEPGCPIAAGHGEPGHGTYIRFTGRHHQFVRVAASDVLAAARPGGHRSSSLVTALQNGVVILGGTYDAARDRYRTPVGDKDGVEILAHAFESTQRPLVESSLAGVAVVEFLVGCIALGLLLVLPLGSVAKALLAFAAPFVLAVPVSFIAFNYFGSYVSVIGSFAGIPFHHFLEMFFESRRESRETEESLRKTVEALEDRHLADQLILTSAIHALRRSDADDSEVR